MKVHPVVLNFTCKETNRKDNGHIYAVYMVALNERALNLGHGIKISSRTPALWTN
jgi:hypothetical protein